MVTEGKITFGKKPTKEMRTDFLTKHVDAATMLKLHGWIGDQIPVRREQANPESVTLSADRDDCCAETWKLVTDGSGDANSGGHSSGTGGIRHDELMESEVFF